MRDKSAGRFEATTRQGRESPLVMGAARGSEVFPTRRLVVGVRVSSAVMVRRLVAEVPAAPVQVALVLVEPVQHVGILPAAITVDLQCSL